jgi:hypothetical protein
MRQWYLEGRLLPEDQVCVSVHGAHGDHTPHALWQFVEITMSAHMHKPNSTPLITTTNGTAPANVNGTAPANVHTISGVITGTRLISPHTPTTLISPALIDDGQASSPAMMQRTARANSPTGIQRTARAISPAQGTSQPKSKSPPLIATRAAGGAVDKPAALQVSGLTPLVPRVHRLVTAENGPSKLFAHATPPSNTTPSTSSPSSSPSTPAQAAAKSDDADAIVALADAELAAAEAEAAQAERELRQAEEASRRAQAEAKDAARQAELAWKDAMEKALNDEVLALKMLAADASAEQVQSPVDADTVRRAGDATP